jgi:SAM-dependent methyltransferase
VWSDGERYEAYMGRWSREVSRRFVPWLAAPPGARWLDIGRGTGALSSEIVRISRPALICGIDPSPGYLHAAESGNVALADARALPFARESFDFVVSGLVLNFVPDVPAAIGEMRRVTAAGATVGAYVWDYGEGMQILRYFWQAAAEVDDAAREQDEGARFAICRAQALNDAFASAGLGAVVVEPIDVRARFTSFDDYWQPFLRAQGPASSYLSALDQQGQERLRRRLQESLPLAEDGSLNLLARAWAVRGTN